MLLIEVAPQAIPSLRAQLHKIFKPINVIPRLKSHFIGRAVYRETRVSSTTVFNTLKKFKDEYIDSMKDYVNVHGHHKGVIKDVSRGLNIVIALLPKDNYYELELITMLTARNNSRFGLNDNALEFIVG